MAADNENIETPGCVAQEISQLKAHLQSRCKVIESVGDFAYIITIQLQVKNLSLKFQLTEQYPDVTPAIIPFSNILTSTNSTQLLTFLMEKSEQFVGKPMIQNLVDACLQWVTENESGDIMEPVKGKNKPTVKHAKKKCLKNKEDKIVDKKPAMKTASDVISRILWDDNIKSEDFIIGYMDRFVGIIEKSFSSFSWEDISSVDYYTLAIPKHRIFYFKYKTIKVWDKVQRLDLVFGSTGSKMTITDVISNYEEQLKCNIEENFLLESDSGPEMLSDPNLFCDDEFCAKTKRPNFFVALRITNEEILERVASMKEEILKNEPTYIDCFIPPVCLHLTLCMLHLDQTSQIADATTLLKNLHGELSRTVAGCNPIRIRNLNQFSNRVIYGCADVPEELTGLVKKLKCYFQEEKLLVDEVFTPHMTIMKLTHQVSRLIGSHQIKPDIYERFINCNFGEQPVDNLYLCSTEQVHQDDGFYRSTTNLKL